MCGLNSNNKSKVMKNKNNLADWVAEALVFIWITRKVVMDYSEAIEIQRIRSKIRTVSDLEQALHDHTAGMTPVQKKREANALVALLRERERLRKLRRN